ncbi:hypothetical protein So717_24290 [Roseobacter cerasinus]|uniref:eCIS core domain-containing protein n=1 Tax=Roseobacter cerasinus TaxID=2602289 RepID=A0A640VWR0_9RHOB|nr:DUF4157 domain-containing protein [Roseobacter cerasinus]GFE50676.1 hypothetical protein So717_24290 [Roseobacter cerasinus]
MSHIFSARSDGPHFSRKRQSSAPSATVASIASKSHALQARADQSAAVRQLARWTGKPVLQREGMPEEQASGGLPADLRSGVESLSGMDMSDVRVHYNSSAPAQFQAHAYAQGSDIHLAPGQEKHLPHEAWHTVQQKQGRVQPTRQLAGSGAAINDNVALEREADVMGARAASAPAQRVAEQRDD